MTTQSILDLTLRHWCTLKLHTATDQHLAINQTTGALASFRKNNPNEGDDAKWFKFLIVPCNIEKGEFWLFSQGAQNGAGELVSRWRSNELGQWGFENEKWQVFQIIPLDTFDKDGKVAIRIVEDDRAISTRWDAAAFLWEYLGYDDQQWLHIRKAERCPMPEIPKIEGELGQLDRELLKVEGYDSGVVRETEPRVVGTQLVSFPRVADNYSRGRQMKETPFYLLTHTCYWRLVKDVEYDGASSVDETLEWEIGTRTSKEISIDSSLKITVGAKTTYKSITGFSGELNFAAEFGHRWKSVEIVERYEKTKGTYHVSYESGKRARVVVWALVNRYTLTRQNGDLIGKTEFIEKDDAVNRCYPPV